jgi:RNA polymerase sigma-70 factor (ECF subfamily)
LPSRGRGLADTDDLVQVTLIRAFNRIGEFEPRRPGAFLAYLRQILLNLVREEIRRSGRKPAGEAPSADLMDRGPSPVEQVIGSETLERYEQALSRMPEHYREAVVVRVELGLTYEEMAEVLERPTANAARLLVSRALVALAKEMEVDEEVG